jgi:hypothetical protein
MIKAKRGRLIEITSGSPFSKSFRDRSEPMTMTMLNLTDLDNLVRSFEKLYGVSSVEMLRDESFRAKISEGVLLRWEAYVSQRSWLRESYDVTHKTYLSQLTHESVKGSNSKHDSRAKHESSKSAATSDVLAYAA